MSLDKLLVKKVYAGVGALLGWFALAIILNNSLAGKSGGALLGGLVGYLSYFTILSNLLIALAFSLPLFAPESKIGRWVAMPRQMGAFTVYIMITFVVYALLLAGSWSPQGLLLFANLALHYILPLAFLLYYLVFVPHGQVVWLDSLRWLIFPLGYAVYTFARGAIINYYPYFFLDAGSLGYPQALLNVLVLSLVFLVFGLTLIALDRGLARRQRV